MNSLSSTSKSYWEKAVAEIEIKAGRSLHIPDTSEVSKAAKNFHITYAPNWWDWSAHNTTIIHNALPAKKNSEKEESDRAKWIGLVVSLASALFAGWFASSFLKAREDLSLTEKRINTMNSFRQMHTLFCEQREIDMRNFTNARDKFFSSVTLLGGGVSAVAGGFMVSSALITAGYAAMIFGALALLFSAGLHWSDPTANRENAYNIVGCKYNGKHYEGLAEKARRELCRYDKDMNYIREEGEEYVPLYAREEVPSTYRPPSAPFEEEGATA